MNIADVMSLLQNTDKSLHRVCSDDDDVRYIRGGFYKTLTPSNDVISYETTNDLELLSSYQLEYHDRK